MKQTEQLACSYEGDPLTIGFNAKFLVEMLGVLESEEIKIELSFSQPGRYPPAGRRNRRRGNPYAGHASNAKQSNALLNSRSITILPVLKIIRSENATLFYDLRVVCLPGSAQSSRKARRRCCASTSIISTTTSLRRPKHSAQTMVRSGLQNWLLSFLTSSTDSTITCNQLPVHQLPGRGIRPDL